MGSMGRGSTPKGEARSPRVTMMEKPTGLLTYAVKGQMTTREQVMGNGGRKPSFSKTVGYYPTPPVGPGKRGK